MFVHTVNYNKFHSSAQYLSYLEIAQEITCVQVMNKIQKLFHDGDHIYTIVNEITKAITSIQGSFEVN